MTNHVTSTEPSRLAPGRRIEVRNRFNGSWARGFEIAEVVPDGYRLRRLSDLAVLPAVFAKDDIRRERRGGTWWY